ncbi:MAG: amidohydrolase [Woeseia sp.]|nr:amidohydrolase [Woeseia sp.]|tara:strand:- start:132 stop:1829 length:1698 start_codon:yes stop_codon:yes gene_type:complete
MNNRIFLPLLVLTISACTQPSQHPADAVYTNARIYTVDSNNSWAEAMAVTDGKIIALGTADNLADYTGEMTTVHDLKGRMVMPGIHDTHIHPSDAGIQKQLQCSFLEYQLDAALAAIEGCLSELEDGEWLRGGQWNDGLFIGAEGKMPKHILDEIAPNNPVFLMDWTVHNGWVNSAALELFGIDDDTPDPVGGVIVRDLETGEATGILYDNAAYNQRNNLPAYDLEDRAAALSWSINEIMQYGVTTIKEALVTTANMEAYAQLDANDALPINIKTSLTWKSAWAKTHDDEIALIDSRDKFASDRIDVNFAKIMLDGIPPTYTGATLEPYEPSEAFGDNWRGKLMHDPEELAADVVALDAKGLTVKIHATADRSVRVALDAIEAARKANGDSGLIHEVSHAELIHPDDVPRFAELNVAAEMCPILWYPMLGLDWEAWLGPDRKVWPVKRMVDSGALVIYGSDWAVVPTPNPWPGIESMVTRADPYNDGEETYWPEQAVDLETAIQIFTVNSAIANKVGDTSGSLEVGKDADFLVLDRNIFEVPITDVGETVVLMSVVGGQAIINKL